MVALFGFLLPGEIFRKVACLCERRAVNALEHFIFRVAVPVGAGALGKLECLDPAGIRYVRPDAKLDEITLFIE